jgi:hypothetical protein
MSHTVINLPSCDDISPEVLFNFSLDVEKEADNFCKASLPNYESVFNFLDRFGEKPVKEYEVLKQARGSQLNLLVTAEPGSNEGYRCNAYLTRSMYPVGHISICLLTAKFWAYKEAQELAMHLQNSVF